jgi:hypothetical protein
VRNFRVKLQWTMSLMVVSIGMANSALCLAEEVPLQCPAIVGQGLPLEGKNPTQVKILEIRNGRISDSALKVVFNHDLRQFEESLLKVLEGAPKEPGAADEPLPASLRKFYESLFFPEDLIAPRLAAAHHIDEKNIIAVLGDLSLEETFRLFIGKPEELQRLAADHQIQVAPDSLVGRYIQESGAAIGVRTYKETVPSVAGEALLEGPSRLAVQIDETTIPIWKKYFSNTQAYSVIGHGNLVFNGKVLLQTSNMLQSEMRKAQSNTPLPYVLLKTTEGARMERYLTAFRSAINHGKGFFPVTGYYESTTRSPWNQIPGKDGKPYCDQKGAYSCCIHWHGNIPVGDDLVNDIILPGPGNKPVVCHLSPPDTSDPALAHVRDVWTYPLHKPISAVLGLAENNGLGDFAGSFNVIQTLLTRAPTERVPFVIHFVPDARMPVNPDGPLYFEGRNQ